MSLEAENQPSENSWHPEIGEFVWAKVRSHPWWPAKVFNPASASTRAQKGSRPGHYLIAFYGDQTFNWLKLSDLLPFVPNFHEKSKQTTAKLFCSAVVEALIEIDKKEVKDSDSNSDTIPPSDLLKYVRNLATSPLLWSDDIILSAKMRNRIIQHRDRKSPASHSTNLFAFLHPESALGSEEKSDSHVHSAEEEDDKNEAKEGGKEVKQKRKSKVEGGLRRKKKSMDMSDVENEDTNKTAKRSKQQASIEVSEKLPEPEDGVKEKDMDVHEEEGMDGNHEKEVEDGDDEMEEKDMKGQSSDEKDGDFSLPSPPSTEGVEKKKRGRKRKSVEEIMAAKEKKKEEKERLKLEKKEKRKIEKERRTKNRDDASGGGNVKRTRKKKIKEYESEHDEKKVDEKYGSDEKESMDIDKEEQGGEGKGKDGEGKERDEKKGKEEKKKDTTDETIDQLKENDVNAKKNEKTVELKSIAELEKEEEENKTNKDENKDKDGDNAVDEEEGEKGLRLEEEKVAESETEKAPELKEEIVTEQEKTTESGKSGELEEEKVLDMDEKISAVAESETEEAPELKKEIVTEQGKTTESGKSGEQKEEMVLDMDEKTSAVGIKMNDKMEDAGKDKNVMVSDTVNDNKKEKDGDDDDVDISTERKKEDDEVNHCLADVIISKISDDVHDDDDDDTHKDRSNDVHDAGNDVHGNNDNGDNVLHYGDAIHPKKEGHEDGNDNNNDNVHSQPFDDAYDAKIKSTFIDLNDVYNNLVTLSRSPNSWKDDYEALKELFLKYRSNVYVKSSKGNNLKLMNESKSKISASKTPKEKSKSTPRKSKKEKDKIAPDTLTPAGDISETTKQKRTRKRIPKEQKETKDSKESQPPKTPGKRGRKRKIPIDQTETILIQKELDAADVAKVPAVQISNLASVGSIMSPDSHAVADMDAEHENKSEDGLNKEEERRGKAEKGKGSRMEEKLKKEKGGEEGKERKKRRETDQCDKGKDKEKDIEKGKGKEKEKEKEKVVSMKGEDGKGKEMGKGKEKERDKKEMNVDSHPHHPSSSPYLQPKKVFLQRPANKPQSVSQPLPQVLHMKFSKGMALPSVSELRAVFVRFGSLIPSSVRLNRQIMVAQVAYVDPRNAERALRLAEEERIFGNKPVKFSLRYLPEPKQERNEDASTSLLSSPPSLPSPSKTPNKPVSILKNSVSKPVSLPPPPPLPESSPTLASLSSSLLSLSSLLSSMTSSSLSSSILSPSLPLQTPPPQQQEDVSMLTQQEFDQSGINYPDGPVSNGFAPPMQTWQQQQQQQPQQPTVYPQSSLFSPAQVGSVAGPQTNSAPGQTPGSVGVRLNQLLQSQASNSGPGNANIAGDMMALLQKVSTLVSSKPE